MGQFLEINEMQVVIVFGAIMLLILFYKVWGMTDDVKEIKKMMAEKMKQDNQPENFRM